MAEPLPTEFDVVVLGTGLAESIVSAAASRNGHNVLHLDPREYYGGKWATLSWDALLSGSFAENPENISPQSNLMWTNAAHNFEQFWYLECEELKTNLMTQSRRFNIDLYPRAILAREEIISLLIGSNVSRYLEFLRIAKLMSSLPPPAEDTIESIPLSRSDIFTSKSIGLVEKRGLVKLIESVLKTGAGKNENEEDEKDESDSLPKTFEELTSSHKISDKVKHFIHSAVKILDDGFDSTKAGFQTEFSERCRVFLQSIGRYGNQTPYLWTLYGISEICQAFCRLSAVYKGIFILNRFIDSVRETETGFDIVAKEDVKASTKFLIVGPEVNLKENQSKKVIAKTLARGVLLTNGLRIKNERAEKTSGGDGSQLYIYKIRDMEIIELDHTSQAVPKNHCLVHVTFPYTTSTSSPKEIIEAALSPFLDFKPTAKDTMSNAENEEKAVEPETEAASSASPDTPKTEKPHVVYGAYFLMDFFQNESYENGSVNTKIFSCATDSTEITAEVNKAREIFTKMFPGEEFLPKAPDACEENEDDEEEDELDAAMAMEERNVGELEGAEVKDDTLASKPHDNLNGISNEGDGDK